VAKCVPLRRAVEAPDTRRKSLRSIKKLVPFGDFVQAMWPPLENLKINDYDPIADVFDEVMGNDFHAATHPIRRKVALQLTRDTPLRCLDLCCGTGLFFELLGNDLPIMGYGLDRSAREIGIAKKRTTIRNMRIDFRVGDVITAEYPTNLNMVTINFDALNHLNGASLWRQVFRKVFRALGEDGAFLFDINLPERLAHDWDRPEVIIKNDILYVQVSFRPKVRGNRVVRRTPMIVFSRCSDDHFVRSVALIEQFAMPVREVVALALSAGFRSADVLTPPTAHAVDHIFNKNRAFILARR